MGLECMVGVGGVVELGKVLWEMGVQRTLPERQETLSGGPANSLADLRCWGCGLVLLLLRSFLKLHGGGVWIGG